MQISHDMKQAMIDEIASAIGQPKVPEYAMTFHELMEQTNSPDNALRKWLKGEIEAGRWEMSRYGQKVYYWKLNGDSHD